MQLFGFSFKRADKEQPELPSFTAAKETDDGALVVSAGGAYGTMVDLDGTVRSEAELVTKYREMSLHPECDSAIDEIVNESIAIDEKNLVKIDLDALKVSEPLKKVIREEFETCLRIIEFNRYAYEIYRRWYIDGRLYYHVVIDDKNPQEGIKELRYIDPRKIRKVREIQKKRAGQDISEPVLTKVVNEYYIFNDKGFNYGNKAVGASNTTGLKIAKDSIIHVVSGLTDNQGTLVLSYLHKAIKALNQLSTLEDALVIYRLARAPERRIWYIDVGNLPKMKAEQYVRDIMVKHKNRLIYDAATGAVRDDRKFMCYSMDTKIPLLDGRTLTLQELMGEYEAGKKNWVYSCDPITGKFVPGPVSWAGVTKKNSQVVRVTLDNGKSVICTPDHKFPVWNKGFIEAKDLVGESIIPGYRRNEKIGGGEYEQIFQNETGTWEFTHRLVSKWKDDNNLREELLFKVNRIFANVIHHNDFNRFNNNPENLIIMDYKDHFAYHAHLNKLRWETDIAYRNKMIDIQTIEYPQSMLDLVLSYRGTRIKYSELLDILNGNNEEFVALNANKRIKNKPILKVTYGNLRRILEMLGFKDWTEFRRDVVFDGKKYRSVNQAAQELGVTFIRHSMNSDISYRGSDKWKEKLSKSSKGKVKFCKSWKITTPSGEQFIVDNLNEYCRNNGLNRTNIKGPFGSKKYHAEILRNHKAISVEWLEETMDVGCITVDLEETYHSHHTYLLDAGVYTKNTMLEDYWLPRREGGRGTEVSTLPGGSNLGQMDDVLYFQKKFLQTLNVPISRLNSDALFSIGRATEITRDELKFERFITRLRSRFSHLFIKMLEKQLVLKGVTTIEDWETIQNQIKFEFAKDNYFAELKRAEILQNRITQTRDMQDMAGKYVSHSWIRKNVMQQSDEDIEQQDIVISLENQSGDPRWVNPMIVQNEQIASQDQQGMAAPEEQPEQSDGDRDKLEQVRQAISVVNLTKKKPIDQRTPQEQSNYKAAVQLVAKNPDIVQQLGSKIY